MVIYVQPVRFDGFLLFYLSTTVIEIIEEMHFVILHSFFTFNAANRKTYGKIIAVNIVEFESLNGENDTGGKTDSLYAFSLADVIIKCAES